MKDFEIPIIYKSDFITKIKSQRDKKDPLRKDFSPTTLDFGAVKFFIARHFGFCYGVKNAIELSYKAIEENPDKRIFLLSEMIHNPEVNEDLKSRGVKFIFETNREQIISWDELKKNDIIIIPAFGTTIETEDKLKRANVDIRKYNTTCPFVEKVWKRAYTLGKDNFTVVVHGKYNHEETRATYSHSKMNAPTIIVYDLAETKAIGDFILGKISKEKFLELFKGRYTEGFDPETNFLKLGVVNQTTMLATETREISDYLFNIMKEKYGENNIAEHFADTRDTLCYATHDNQSSTYALLETDADIAIVVGGYNSSNTSHIVQLCSKKLKTYFISSEEKIISDKEIMHYDLKSGKEIITENYLPDKDVAKIILTSGASCPDSIVEAIMKKILAYYKNVKSIEEVISVCKEDSQTN